MKRCRAPILTLTAALTLATGAAQAADPTTADCLAASDSSLKLGNEHKLRAERAQLLVCAAAACPADIRNECVRRVDEVNAQIPTIIFEAKDASGNDLSAVKVTMDGELLAERLEGTSLSIDPGEHTFAFETPAQTIAQKRFAIRQNEKDRRERITFGGAADSTSTSISKLGAAMFPLASDAPPPSERSGPGTQRLVAIAAGGVGVVGVALGTAFGLEATSKRNDARNVCPNQCADQNGLDAWSRARSAGNVSTAAFVVGVVGLTGGVVLWLTAKHPSQSAPSVQVGVSLGTIDLGGRW